MGTSTKEVKKATSKAKVSKAKVSKTQAAQDKAQVKAKAALLDFTVRDDQYLRQGRALATKQALMLACIEAVTEYYGSHNALHAAQVFVSCGGAVANSTRATDDQRTIAHAQSEAASAYMVVATDKHAPRIRQHTGWPGAQAAAKAMLTTLLEDGVLPIK